MTDSGNPYGVPTTSSEAASSPGAGIETAPCPNCGGTEVKKPSFTWWGGALGPKLFSHVVCLKCRTGFNSKNGKSNRTAITAYVVISFVIVFGVLVLTRL